MTIRRVEQTSRRVRYRGGWKRRNDSRDLGGSVAETRTDGASASFAFTGMQLAVVMNTGVRGHATISLDGTRRSTLHLDVGGRREVVFTHARSRTRRG